MLAVTGFGTEASRERPLSDEPADAEPADAEPAGGGVDEGSWSDMAR